MKKALLLVLFMSQLYGCAGVGWNLHRFESDSNTFISERPGLKVSFQKKPIFLGEKKESFSGYARTLYCFLAPNDNKKASFCAIIVDDYGPAYKSYKSSLEDSSVGQPFLISNKKGEITEAVSGISQEALTEVNLELSARGYSKYEAPYSNMLLYGYYKYSYGCSISVVLLTPKSELKIMNANGFLTNKGYGEEKERLVILDISEEAKKVLSVTDPD